MPVKYRIKREPDYPVEPMPEWPEFFYLLVNYPTLIVVPIVVFGGLALWSHSRTAWVTTVAWALYLVYEFGMKAGIFCSGDGCIKRSPLYVVYPLLALLSFVALVQVFVHIRDKRPPKPLPTIRR